MTTEKLFSNTLYLIISSIATTILSLVYWIVIGKHITPHDYGIISTTANLTTYLSVLSTFGFGLAVSTLIPKYLGEKNTQKINSLLSFSFKFIMIFSIFIALILILFSSIFAGILNLPKFAILLTSIFIIIVTLSNFINFTLQGFQNMKWIPVFQIFGNLAKITVSIVFIFLGFGYKGPLFGFLSYYLIVVLIGVRLVRFPRGGKGVDYKQIIFNYCLPTLLSTIAYYAFDAGQFIILNIIKGPSITGIFSVATVLTAPIIFLPSAFSQAFFPLSSELITKKSYKALSIVIKQIIRYTAFITIPSIFFLTIFSKQLIVILFTPAYLESAKLIPIISFATIFFTLGIIFHRIIYTMNRTRLYRNIMFISISLFLILSITMTYKFSALGMSYAILIFSIIFSILSFYNARKLVKITIPILSICKIFIATLISMLILYSVSKLVQNIFLMLVIAIIDGLFYLFILFLMNFFEKDDMKIITKLKSLISLRKIKSM